jgi:alpha-glucosidase (family GH31 glycosyl hydrolase)
MNKLIRNTLFCLAILPLNSEAQSNGKTQSNSEAQSNKILQRKVADTNIVLPPSWAFGVMYGGYTNQEQTVKRVEEIIEKDYPIDAYWIDSWFWSFDDKGVGPHKYIDFVADTIAYPNRNKMWTYLEKNGVKGGFWIWDCIQETGNEKAFNDFKNKGFFKDIYINKNTWHNKGTSTAMFQQNNEHPGTPTGNIDFDNPAAVQYFKESMKPFFEEGADFIKLDRTSKINTCKAMFEMSQEFGKETKGRGFVLSHTGGQESPEYKKYPTKWTDDTRSDWNVENPLIKFDPWVPNIAFKENIAMFTDPSKKTSDIPFLTNDLGGFDMGKTKMPEEELYIRWLQFSMLNPITEVFSQPENPTANLAWMYSEKADSIFRKYAHWRMELFPYIYSYAHRTRIEGKNMMGQIPGHIYQYLFGNEMLVAPVYEKGATIRKLFLPEGNWINYWTGEQLKGNKEIVVAAPLEQIPVLIKQGSIIPRRAYASSIEKGSNETLTLEVFGGANGKFTLIEDDGTSNDYLKGIYASTKIDFSSGSKEEKLRIHAVEGRYKDMLSERKWNLELHSERKPSKVSVNNTSVKFSYDKEHSKIIVSTGNLSINKNVIFTITY